jgi:hypothetical protein
VPSICFLHPSVQARQRLVNNGPHTNASYIGCFNLLLCVCGEVRRETATGSLVQKINSSGTKRRVFLLTPVLCVVAQAVSRWPVTADGQVRAPVSQCGICGERSNTVTGF